MEIMLTTQSDQELPADVSSADTKLFFHTDGTETGRAADMTGRVYSAARPPGLLKEAERERDRERGGEGGHIKREGAAKEKVENTFSKS